MSTPTVVNILLLVDPRFTNRHVVLENLSGWANEVVFTLLSSPNSWVDWFFDENVVLQHKLYFIDVLPSHGRAREAYGFVRACWKRPSTVVIFEPEDQDTADPLITLVKKMAGVLSIPVKLVGHRRSLQAGVSEETIPIDA